MQPASTVLTEGFAIINAEHFQITDFSISSNIALVWYEHNP
jgi:hypothetical protein